MDIGEKVKKLLFQANLKPADLARGTGIDPAYLSRLLNGKARWNKDHIDKVSAFLRISSSSLFDLKMSEPGPPIYAMNDSDRVQMISQATIVVEQFAIEHPELEISPQRRQRMIQKLYEHWILDQDQPSLQLAKKYFLIS
jgi:transcriptional regulator with XRE-family HTH domain